jgi:hypothetical protein
MRPASHEEHEKIKIKETPLPWKQLSGALVWMPLLCGRTDFSDRHLSRRTAC